MAKPILLSNVDTETLAEEEWLRWREHGPDGSIKWTIGGSDVSKIMGCNPWSTLREFYDQKKGVRPKLTMEYNREAKEIGHMEEAHILYHVLFPQLKKDYPGHDITVGQDKCMYACGDRNPDGTLKYPYMVVNTDGYVIIDGKVFLVEIKTTSAQNYRVIEEWKQGIVPEYYDWQVRYYMKAMNVDGCIICCRWDLRGKGEGFNYIFVSRDKEVENYMLDKCDHFVFCLENNIIPSIEDDDPTLALSYYYRLYGINADEKTEVELPDTPAYRNAIENYLHDEQLIERYQRIISDIEARQKKELLVLAPLFDTAQKARLNISDREAYFIECRPSYKRDIPMDEEKLKNQYPAIYEKCQKLDKSRLREEYPDIFREVKLQKVPLDSRKWKIRKWERK